MDSGQVLTIRDGLVTSIGSRTMTLPEEVKKLNDLLQDPHPGLSTWQEAFNSQGKKVFEILAEAGFVSTKAKESTNS